MRLTETQKKALEQIKTAGKWYAYNGISRATIRVLQRNGLIDVEWSSHTWTNYRSKSTHHMCDWVATPKEQG